MSSHLLSSVPCVQKGQSRILASILQGQRRHSDSLKRCSCSVVLVDEYSHPAYISSKPNPPLDPPIRHLQTQTSNFKPTARVASFEPPNLLLSPSAAFLTILEAEQAKSIPGLLILLPLPHIPHPPPQAMQPVRITVAWPESQMKAAHTAIVPSSKWAWDATLAKNAGRLVATKKVKRKLSDSMNMYI